MAKIKNTITGSESLLLPVHFFGRHALYPYTTLNGDNISRQHALLRWGGGHWLLEDTSANGSYVNNARIEKEQKLIINQGDIINFGHYDSWEVVDLTPPKCMLISTDQQLILELTPAESLIVPDSGGCTVFSSESGEWIFKTDNTLKILKHGSKVDGQQTWTYFDAKPDSLTLVQSKYDDSLIANKSSDLLNENNTTFIHEPPTFEVLRQASLDISLFLYKHGMARQTSKKLTGSIIKPLCRKDGGQPYGTVDINVWKAWVAGNVKCPQVDKLELFSHYLLKQFPIIELWSQQERTNPLSLPLTIKDKQKLIQVAENLHNNPHEALMIWQQKNNVRDIKVTLNTLPNEVSGQECFDWLRDSQEPVDFSMVNKNELFMRI